MKIKNGLIWLCILFAGFTANAWAVADTIVYTYDNDRQVIRTNYNNNTVIDYVYDGVGNRLVCSTSVNGVPANNPPTMPVNPLPANGSANIAAITQLSWSSSDPDPDDQIVYDLYLGTSGNPPLYREAIETASFQPERLLPATTYYWKIKTRDNHNAVSESPIWSFTTGNEAPSLPVALLPVPSSTIAYANAYLNWQGSDPDVGDSLTYDVYFGTSATPPLVKSNHVSMVYNLGALTNNTTYYWKITTKDNHGASTEGPVWSFITADHTPVMLNSTITTDTTLIAADGPYIVGSGFGVQAGATLTIQPGTILKMQANACLYIYGTLIAEGQNDNPIIITSEKDDTYGGDTNGDGSLSYPVKGDWQTIYLQNNADVSRLSHVKFFYAGGSGNNGALYCGSGSTSITNCTISNSAGYGVYINNGSQTITNTVFINNTKYDIYIVGSCSGAISGNSIRSGIYAGSGALGNLSANTIAYNDSYPIRLHADDIGRLLSNNTIGNVTANSYLEVTGGTIARDATWTALMPYRILGSIIVQGTDGGDAVTTLTIQPGAKLLFNQYTQLTIGAYSGAPGALNAQGTSANRILFTSGKTPQAAGDWYGITFYPTTSSATVLDYCTVQYAGGSGQGALYIYQCSPTIKNTIVSNSSNYGVYVYNGSPIIQNCQFTSNANYDLYYSGTVGGTVSGCTINNGIYFTGANTVNFSGNTINYNNNRPIRVNANDVSRLLAGGTIGNTTPDSYLEVMGGIISKDAVWTSALIYHILGTITVQGTDGADAVTTFTIQPGAKLLFNQYTQLIIGAASGAPGALNAQGTSANRILFTSGKTPQAAGDWYGITFNNTTNDATTILSYCTIEYAGTGANGSAVNISSASPTLSYCTIRYSQGDGIFITQTGAPNISYCTISNCGRYGIYVAAGAPTITNNTFTSNGNFDLYITSGTNVVITGNTLQRGIYVGSGVLGNISANTITYNDSYPIRLNADDVGKLLANNTISNVTDNSYLEVTTGTISHDATWTTLMPYRILGSIIVQGTDGGDAVTTLTIQPGAKLLFNQSTGLTIGAYSGAPGALNAQGTSANPILFTSGKSPQAAGDWGGIYFYTTSGAYSFLNYCTIQYAGGGSYGALYIYQCSPTIMNTMVRNSSSYGVYVSSGSPIIQNCQFIANSNYDLYYSGTAGGTVSGCTINNGIYFTGANTVNFSGNTINYNNNRPIRVNANDVSRLLAGGTIGNTTPDSYLEVMGGIISKDAVWTSVITYRILNSITVQGTDGADAVTTFTIQPGAKLLFNQYTQLIIGAYSGAPGALNAQGTSANRILFTSGKTPQAAGDWYGITFYTTTSSATVLDYCTVQYAGYGGQGALYVYQCSPTIKNTIVSNSGSYGVYVSSGSPIIQNCQFTSNANYDLYYNGTAGGTVSGCTINNGIYFSGTNTVNFSGNTINYNNNRPIRINADDVSRLLAGGTIGNTTPDSYLDVMGGIITKDAVWTNAITYHILGSITVQGIDGADAVTTLTIQPGAKLMFNQYTQLIIGANSGAPGALSAQGTSANPILFTSGKTPQAVGDWYGIYFYNTTNDATTILDYCLVQYAGYGSYGAIYIDQAAPTIKNTTANNSSSCGVYIYNSSPTIQNSLFNTNGNYDLYYSGTVAGSVQGCTINKGIYLLATSTVNFSGTTVNYNNAFPIKLYADSVGAVLSGTTLYNINSNSYLAVSGGTISHDAAWTSVIPYYIMGNILVQGKDGTDNVTTLTIQPGALLLFYQYTSLTIGNSSGDPGALIAQGTTANPIWFTSSKTTPAAGDWYGIWFYNTADDSTSIMEYGNVEYGGYGNQGGIYIWDANPTLRYNNITNNKYGIYVYSGNPVITNNNIYDNIGYGLYRATASILSAQDNWWGNATGPYHPTANPAGTGNAVSNYVNFIPWLTE